MTSANNLSRNSIISAWRNMQENTEQCYRQQLTDLYHILDGNGWTDTIFTHCSVRLPGEDAFLFNPFGLMFNEITKENIVKVKFNGEFDSMQGYPINNNGSVAHIAIYKARPDVNCIIHTHSQNGMAFSNLTCKLYGLDQTTMFLNNQIGYHEFNSLFMMDESQNQLIKDLNNNICMILRNHGLISVGSSVPMAFWNYYFLEKACATQLQLMATGKEINYPDDKTIETVTNQYKQWHRSENGYPGNADLLFLAESRKLSLPK